MNATQEEWRPVVGLEEFYVVSNRGRVHSLPRITERSGAPMRVSGKLISQATGPKGYQTVTIRRSAEDSDFIPKHVHRLVAFAFLGEKPADGYVVCHCDGNPANNAAENLRWDTYRENNLDITRHGRNVNRNKTHCQNGHEFTPENTHISKQGQRRCRTCRRAWLRNYKAIRSAR